MADAREIPRRRRESHPDVVPHVSAPTLDDNLRQHGSPCSCKRTMAVPACASRAGSNAFRTQEGLYGNFPIEVTETTNRYVFIDRRRSTPPGQTRRSTRSRTRSTERANASRSWPDEEGESICRERAVQLQNAYRSLLWDHSKGEVFVNGRDLWATAPCAWAFMKTTSRCCSAWLTSISGNRSCDI